MSWSVIDCKQCNGIYFGSWLQLYGDWELER